MNHELIDPETVGTLTTQEAPEAESIITADNVASIFSSPQSAGNSRTGDLSVQNAMIQGRPTDMPTIELAKSDFDATASLAASAENVFLELEGKLSDAGRAFSEISPDNLPGVIEQLVQGQEQVNTMRASPVSTELAVIQKAANVPLGQAVKEELAVSLAMRNEISKMLDDQGMLEFVADISGNFVPFRMGQDFSDLQSNIENSPELNKHLSGDNITSMISTWQALGTDRKLKLLPELTEAVLAATGVDYSLGLGIPFLKSDKNVLNAAGILLRFLQPEGGERAELTRDILTVVDVVGLGLGSGIRGAKSTAQAAKISTALAKIPKGTRQAMEGLLLKAADYSRRKHSPVKLIAQAGDNKTAAAINLSVMADKDIARAYGIPADVAYGNSMPMQFNATSPEWIKGLVSETAEAMNEYIRGQAGFVRSMTSESRLMRIGALDASERRLVVTNFEQEMASKGEDLLLEGISMTDFKVIDGTVGADGFKFEYTLTNSKQQLISTDGTGVPISSTHTGFRSWKVDEVTGNFVETAKDLMSPSASSIPGLSPGTRSVTKPGLGRDFNDAVKDSIAIADVETATKAAINEQWLEANATVSSAGDLAGRARIDAIELAGDNYTNKSSQITGRVFTERELIAGVHTDSGTIHLTKPNEVEAYYKRRVFSDSIHSMRNYASRRELQLAGFENSIVVKGAPLAVKRFDTSEAAIISASQRPGYAVWLSEHDVSTVLTPALIQQQYDAGKVLVRSRNDWNTSGASELAGGGEVVEYVFIEPNKLMNLPEQVLHYKVGYVPKIDLNVEFVVKQKRTVNKQGVPGHTQDSVIGKFASEQDADTFLQRQVDLLLAKDPALVPEEVALQFEKVGAGGMSQLERMEGALGGQGGLYTGVRSRDEILMGLDGDKVERMAPGEAFGRYIDHMGNILSRNEWRIGQEKRWLNTVKEMVAATGEKIDIRGFNGTNLPNTPLGKALAVKRDYLNTVNRVPTRQESMFEGAAQKYHDWALNGARGMGLNKNAIKHALWLKHADPIASVLTANMHLYLGAMNPAQIYVQASAAVVALSLSKISSMPHIMASTAKFAMLDNVKNESALAKLLSKLTGMDDAVARETEMYLAWKRSGLLESVRGNADMNYMSATGLGMTDDILRNGGNASLLFYRAGELANRRISFISAFTNWQAENSSVVLLKDGKFVNDDALAKIVNMANQTMLELNGANKAWFQGGADKAAPQRIAAMSTQFLQVLAKTVEATFKGTKRGGFTTQQKGRIAAGQLLFHGAAGVPLVSIGAAAMVDWLGVADDDGVLANTINQGMTGVIAQQVFGADIEVANRAALLQGTLSSSQDIMMSKDPMWKKLFSLAGTTGERVSSAVQDTSMVLRSQVFTTMAELSPMLSHNRAGETEMSVPTMIETATDIATIWAGVTTSGRNLLKARMMHNAGKILDRRSRLTLDESRTPFTFADKLGVAFGFQMTREARKRIMVNTRKDIEEEISEAAQTVIKAYHRYIYTHDMNPAYADTVTRVTQLMHETLDNEWKIERMMSLVNKEIYNEPTSAENRELKSFFERTVPERLAEGVILDTDVSLGKIFREQAIVQPFQKILEQENK